MNKYNPINYDNKNQNKVIKKDIAEQIKKLNDLYKSGALTKEEFARRKEKATFIDADSQLEELVMSI